MSIVRSIQKLARGCGIEIHRYLPWASDDAKLARLLASERIDRVFDVGANAGQYVVQLRAAGYRGAVVSFEPLAEAHAQLLTASRGDALWQVAPPMALGSFDGSAEINVASNSASSSLRGMTDTHLDVAPFSRYVGTQAIAVRRLDSVFEEFAAGCARPFLKIDTQGYEADVLAGAEGCIRRFAGIQTEMSLVELYQGQALFFELAERIRAQGFELVGLFPGLVDNASGRLLQVDGLFLREEREA